MPYRFPYFEDRPHLPIALEFKGKRARFLPLLDSGADYSVFYESDAIRLGLNWEEGENTTFCNADGSFFEAKKFNLTIEIEGISFKADICFAKNTKSAMPLLGRRGIFEKLFITICEKEKYVEVRKYN